MNTRLSCVKATLLNINIFKMAEVLSACENAYEFNKVPRPLSRLVLRATRKLKISYPVRAYHNMPIQKPFQRHYDPTF